MAKIIIEEDVVRMLRKTYQQYGYPLGKSNKGFKKWAKRWFVEILTAYVENIEGN